MRQGATTRFQSFLRQVDACMSVRHGVGYSEIQAYAEAADAAPRAMDCFREGKTPEDFASRSAGHLRLVGVDGDAAAARETNLRIAALAEFAVENPDWVAGDDGGVYRSEDSGTSRLFPGLDTTGRSWGFRADHSREGRLERSDTGRPRPVGTSFENVAGGRDIGDAVLRLEERLAPSPNSAP